MTNNFNVIEIIDSNTIAVKPGWTFKDREGNEFRDNKVKISGLNIPRGDKHAQHRLSSLLLNREVELVNPVIVSMNKGVPVIACNVLFYQTDIAYYFPEFSNSSKELEYQ